MPISETSNEDCQIMMARYPDKFFDLAIVDPPFFSGPEKKEFYGREFSSHGVKRIDYKPLNQSWEVPDKKYFKELFRVSKDQIVWGCNYFKIIYPGPGLIFWDKVNDQSDYSDGEIAYCSKIKSTRIFRYMWNGMMQGTGFGDSKKMNGNKRTNEKRIHPTQKPIALYYYCLKNYAKPGDKILDTHLGSGSSRIAAYKLGFDFWGTELDKDYFDAQEERFKKAIHEPLFQTQPEVKQKGIFE